MNSSGLADRPGTEWRSAAAFAAVLGGVLVAGLWSLGRIPFYRPFLGLDFQNIYAFHTCPLVKELGVYAPSGSACGDVSGRAFRYPPLIYHLFTWVRLFGFTEAARLWIGFTAASMVIVGGIWAWLDHQIRRNWRAIVLAALWLLLLAQFPSVFQLERGNNDVIPILIWTAAAFAFTRRWYAAAGALGVVAALGKIYPIVALAILAAGVLRMRWRAIWTFASGGVAGIIISALFWPREMITYWTEVLPSFASGSNDVVAYSHPLRGLAVPAGVKIVLGVALVGSWALAAWYKMEKEPALVFAGALAIS
ncbi:MAG: glycosyltransferase family 87 protein, partial [Acidimicrobiia bacterium]